MTEAEEIANVLTRRYGQRLSPAAVVTDDMVERAAKAAAQYADLIAGSLAYRKERATDYRRFQARTRELVNVAKALCNSKTDNIEEIIERADGLRVLDPHSPFDAPITYIGTERARIGRDLAIMYAAAQAAAEAAERIRSDYRRQTQKRIKTAPLSGLVGLLASSWWDWFDHGPGTSKDGPFVRLALYSLRMSTIRVTGDAHAKLGEIAAEEVAKLKRVNALLQKLSENAAHSKSPENP